MALADGSKAGVPTFLYRCPKTAQTVQGWVADDPTKDRDSADVYETIECLACGGLHSREARDWPGARAVRRLGFADRAA